MLKMEIGIYCQNPMERIEVLRGRNADFCNVSAGGMYNYP